MLIVGDEVGDLFILKKYDKWIVEKVITNHHSSNVQLFLRDNFIISKDE